MHGQPCQHTQIHCTASEQSVHSRQIPARFSLWRTSVMIGLMIWSGIAMGGGNLASDTTADAFQERTYIVQFADPPALTYRGGNGLAATRPTAGETFNPQSASVRQYAQKLINQQDLALQSIGAWHNKLYSYRYTFNGVAVRLTAAQADKLRANKAVLNIWEDGVRYLATNDSPVFLGLYDSADGLASKQGLKGEDIVIGVIDSGITPDHPSFNDSRPPKMPRLCRSTWAENSLLGLWLCKRFKKKEDRLTYQPPQNWNGTCEAGQDFTPNDCNNKIIGARYYADGFLQSFQMDSNEFMSPRDADGHGTHIASTAAGNEVRATLSNSEVDRILGIAPRARIAVYKACWLEPGQTRGSCSTSDLQRAIEDAVADGVDIINYSVGNNDISISDPDDIALLAAANAGVLSVVAAGNDGPFEGTILSPSGAPWVLTVGASSRTGEKFQDALEITAPDNLIGFYATTEATFTPPLRDAGPITGDLVLADDGTGLIYDACESLTNGAEISGQIAFLQRGECDFQVKIENAEAAGAAAVVVFNNSGDPVIMSGTRGSVDIPAVLISQGDGQLLLDELQNDGTISLSLDADIIVTVPEDGNIMASFSSRGPNLTAADILKPDVTAPGVNILAGYTPDVANGIRGESFQYLSGTSMATPHVAGIAALLKEAHPDWSPAAIKSALVTTGRQDVIKEDGSSPADPFDFGGGHVVPNAAVNPGLIYEAGKQNYEAFLCGLNSDVIDDTACELLVAEGYPTEAGNLNQPSIAISALVSERTVTRSVTNVGDAAVFTAAIETPPGIAVSVTPETLSLNPGESADYDITLAMAGAEPGIWQFGAITWNSSDHSARSPIAARMIEFLTPLEVTGTGASGNLSFDIEFGYTGAYTAMAQGLTAPTVIADLTVTDDSDNTYVQVPLDQQMPDFIWRSPVDMVTTTADDTLLRVALFDESTAGDDDLDLYVYYCPTTLTCDAPWFSGNYDSNEQIDIVLPKPGNYLIDVHGFNTEAASTTFDLFVWTVGSGDNPGNLTMTAPGVATVGTTAEVALSWVGLETQTHLGTVSHSNGEGDPEITVIEIQNPPEEIVTEDP